MFRRLACALGVLVLGFAGAAVPPGAAVATEVPVEVRVYASCDALAGLWRMLAMVTNWSPAPAFIGAANDAGTGQIVTFDRTQLDSPGAAQAQWLVPGSTPLSGLRVEVRRADRTQAWTFVEPLALTGCAVATPTPTCVTAANSRYRHTFDGAAGMAMIELVGPNLCPNEFQIFYLEVWSTNPPNWLYSFDRASAGFTGAGFRTKLAMRVARPQCQHTVRLTFDMVNGGTLGDPRFVAGSTQAPGNRSTGPFASYTTGGPSCAFGPNARVVSHDCAGNIQFLLTNADQATVAAPFAFQERSAGEVRGGYMVVLEPGEQRRITYRAENVADIVEIYWNGRLMVSTRWTEPAKCRRDIPVKPAPSVTPSPRPHR